MRGRAWQRARLPEHSPCPYPDLPLTRSKQMLQMNSNLVQVRDFEVVDAVGYPIVASWEKDGGEAVTQVGGGATRLRQAAACMCQPFLF